MAPARASALSSALSASTSTWRARTAMALSGDRGGLLLLGGSSTIISYSYCENRVVLGSLLAYEELLWMLFPQQGYASDSEKAIECGTVPERSAARRWSVGHPLRSANATGHRRSVGRPGVGRDGRRAAVLTPTSARSGLHIDAL